jgi:hypothetical protein
MNRTDVATWRELEALDAADRVDQVTDV